MSDTSPQTLTGGCACGAVRFQARAPAKRSGLCHCLTCRKAHAAACNPFVVFDRAAVTLTGDVALWESSPGYQRGFCPACGSRVIGFDSEEAEISAGSFDEPGLFRPQYKSWVIRREPWLSPLPVPQFDRDRKA